MFSNREKLLLHIDRQKSVSDQNRHMCEFCHKSFTSRSLLLQHVYHHVNHYVCPFCGLTTRAPSDLKRHLFHKHHDEKPFICNEEECNACFKTENDLKRHISAFHKKETKFDCFVNNCGFSCIRFTKLVTHIKAAHKDFDHPQPIYACHICSSRFKTSNPLSKHLRQQHEIKYPDGTTRFRFVLDTDGAYKMQLERVNQLKPSYVISTFEAEDRNFQVYDDRCPENGAFQPTIGSSAFANYVDVSGNELKVGDQCVITNQQEPIVVFLPPSGASSNDANEPIQILNDGNLVNSVSDANNETALPFNSF